MGSRSGTVTSVRLRLDIAGVVQGVGFRPAVARIATRHGLSGCVYNDSGSVHCELEGAPDAVDAATLESAARIALPRRVPQGFHGSWCPGF